MAQGWTQAQRLRAWNQTGCWWNFTENKGDGTEAGATGKCLIESVKKAIGYFFLAQGSGGRRRRKKQQHWSLIELFSTNCAQIPLLEYGRDSES